MEALLPTSDIQRLGRDPALGVRATIFEDMGEIRYVTALHPIMIARLG